MMFGSSAVSALTPMPNNHVKIWMDCAVPVLTAAAAAVPAHGAPLAISQVTALGRRTSLHAAMYPRERVALAKW